MRTRKLVLAASLLLIATVSLISSCSKKKGTNPATTTVEMQGRVVFPDTSLTAGMAVSVGLGDDDQEVGPEGTFTIAGNKHLPGLAVAHDPDGVPLLMGIVPDPQANLQLELNARSTALAMAFLHPLVCISNAEAAESVLVVLESLPELAAVEDLVAERLSADPVAMGQEDEQMDSALSRFVLAYLNSYPDGGLARPRPGILEQPEREQHPADGAPNIEPSVTVSGLKLTWKGGDEYELSNNLGRWCFCCSPEDSFYVFPNGEFIDVLKLGRPWPPSTRKFRMEIEPGDDTAYVDVFGYGFSSYPPNQWDSLEIPEQRRAHWGGMTTVCFELVSHSLSVICNTSNVYGKGTIAGRISESLLGFLFADSRISHRVVLYIKAGDPWGCSWYLTKQILTRLATSASYRAEWASVTGVVLTEGMVGRLASWVLVPWKAVVVYNSVTSLFKTALGFQNSWFKTSFAVWKDVEDFGAVQGQVADKESGLAIAGATVTLAGDEGNPLNPAHEATTGADGRYYFGSIGIGEKTITANKTGYQSHTVTVAIEKDKTITQHITLEHGSGGVSGQIINDLLAHHGVQPATFTGTVDLTARQIGGQQQVRSTYAHDGSYTWSLPEGTWWVIASHDDYDSDSFQVTVPSGGSVAAPRNLVLRPHPTMSGHVYLNLDNQGSPEQSFDVTFSQAGLSRPATGQCPGGGSASQVMDAIGAWGTTSDYDFVYIGFAPALVTEPGQYPIGGFEQYACAGSAVKSYAAYLTTRAYCLYQETTSSAMVFSFHDGSDMQGCNCGIASAGNLYLYTWGTELGDVVEGNITANLPGWNTCECSGNDTDQDGDIDQWTVDCAQAQLSIDFHLIVGSDYLVTLRPGTTSRFIPAQVKGNTE